MKEIINDGKGYTCTCGKYHKFPMYVYAHPTDELIHKCDCGRKVTIYDTTAYPQPSPTTPPTNGTSEGER